MHQGTVQWLQPIRWARNGKRGRHRVGSIHPGRAETASRRRHCHSECETVQACLRFFFVGGGGYIASRRHRLGCTKWAREGCAAVRRGTCSGGQDMPKGGPDIHMGHVHDLAHVFHGVRVFVCCRATCSHRWAATASTEVGRGGAGKFLHGCLVTQVNLSNERVASSTLARPFFFKSSLCRHLVA